MDIVEIRNRSHSPQISSDPENYISILYNLGLAELRSNFFLISSDSANYTKKGKEIEERMALKAVALG